ncbi:MAG TPA: SgcJ/EcaC family oxidoreductase [Acidimicrobiales bacterium]|nr:SgcJ/EcaC family oxidoreductase [Acidimicrobiales bacterium]
MGSAEHGVAAFYEKLAASWSANDGAAFAALFTEDGSLINPFGERADGQDALRAIYNEYFAGMLKGTTTSIRLTHLRPVDTDHAFADAEQTIYAANGDVVLALHVVNLLRRDGDDWRLADSRPYAFSPPPA